MLKNNNILILLHCAGVGMVGDVILGCSGGDCCGVVEDVILGCCGGDFCGFFGLGWTAGGGNLVASGIADNDETL